MCNAPSALHIFPALIPRWTKRSLAESNMRELVGIQFRCGGKIHDYDPEGLDLRVRHVVVVDTAAGPSLGYVSRGLFQMDGHPQSAIRSVLRHATPSDLAADRSHREREDEALRVCARFVEELGLPMRLITAVFALDGTQVTIEFASETRVDFRELVREVATVIRSRVIFHQVGVRDHARAMGTIGHCGQPLCCARFLTWLDPISMKMAKDQSLAINPSKFSGVCGKLMCCLRYEHEVYRDLLAEMPEVGKVIETDRGPARVVDVNVMTGVISANLRDGTPVEIDASELPGNKGQRACGGCGGDNGSGCRANQNSDRQGRPADLL